MNANTYFIFRRFGDGENRFWSKTNAFSYFIFFFLEPQDEGPTCVVQKFPKNSYLCVQTKINRIKKWSFLKILKNNDD